MLSGTTKTKSEINHTWKIENASEKNSRHYIMPSTFLTLKKRLTSLSDQEFSLINTTRKYFGRKIANVSNVSKAGSVRNYYRYFQKISCEEIQSKGSLLAPMMVTIKSLGDLGILDQPIIVNRTSVRRILSVCRCKVSTVSNESHNTEWWLSMPMHVKNNIKNLKITLSKRDHSELLKTTDLFKDFSNVDTCCICIIHDDFDRDYFDRFFHQNAPQEPEPLSFDFVPALCQIKTLKSLELDLSQITIALESLTMLLNEITLNEPSRWHLKVLLWEGLIYKNDPTENEKLKTALNRLDCLAMNANRTHALIAEGLRITNVAGYEHNPTDDLSKMEHLTKKRKRILEMNFHNNSVKDMDLKLILENCISLKGLYIRSLGSCFEIGFDIAENVKLQNKDENEKIQSWASKLEDVVFSFNNNTGCLECPASYLLLPVLEKQSHNLRSLEVFFCISYDYYDDDIKRERIEYLEAPLRGLEQLNLLEDLKLTINGGEIPKLEPILKRLSNLKKLHIVLGLGSKKQPAWDNIFPFKNCGNIQELKITLNPDMKALPWGNDLMQNLHYLQSLNVLEIHDKAKPMPLKTFCSFVSRLMDLKNMRRLIVQTRVINPIVLQEIPEELEDLWKLNLDGVLERLKSQVKNFINSNRGLEELEIGRLERFSFEYFKMSVLKTLDLRVRISLITINIF